MSLLRNLVDKTPVPFTGSARTNVFSMATKSDPASQMAAMGSVGTLFSIVNKTSNATAMADWKLYRKPDGRGRIAGGRDRQEVTSHAAIDLWNKPNPFMPRQEFVETEQQHIDLTGEGWWVVQRDERFNIPIEMWPVRPDRMEPIPDKDEFIAGYWYRAPDGTKIFLDTDSVVFIRMPNPLDIYRGMGPVQAIMTDLDSIRYSAQWNRNFFLNSAEPGGIVEVPDGLSDPDFQKMTMRWNEQHRGVANAHRVAVLERGKWVPRAFSMKDMQFVELRKVASEVIMEAFGISLATLGKTEGVNFAAAKAAKAQFAEMLTVPRLERIKSALNNDFLPMFGATGEGLEWDYESPVPEDEEAENAERNSKADAVKTLVDAGFNPEDVLAAVGLPPMRTVKKEAVA